MYLNPTKSYQVHSLKIRLKMCLIFTWASEDIISFLKLQHKNSYYFLEVFVLSLSAAYIWKTTVQWEIQNLNRVRDKNVGFATDEGTVTPPVAERNSKSLKLSALLRISHLLT